MLKVSNTVTSNTASTSDLAFLLQVVHLYYQRDMKQAEVARHFGVSKMTVSRALKRAEEDGLIEIRLNLPISNNPTLERLLAEQLEIGDVFVVDPPEETGERENSESLRDFLGRASAFFLDALLRDGTIIGICLGRTVSKIVQHVRPRTLQGAKVVQLMGGLDMSATYNPYDIIQRFSRTLGAEGYYFSGTAFVANSNVQEAMLEQNTHAGLRTLWKECDICIASIGSTEADVPYVRAGLLNEEALSEVVAKGAVGDLFGRFFALDGHFIESNLNERVNAAPLDDLRSSARIVVTAGGKDKVLPIIGAARTRLLSILVTDADTARAVLDHLSAPTR